MTVHCDCHQSTCHSSSNHRNHQASGSYNTNCCINIYNSCNRCKTSNLCLSNIPGDNSYLIALGSTDTLRCRGRRVYYSFFFLNAYAEFDLYWCCSIWSISLIEVSRDIWCPQSSLILPVAGHLQQHNASTSMLGHMLSSSQEGRVPPTEPSRALPTAQLGLFGGLPSKYWPGQARLSLWGLMRSESRVVWLQASTTNKYKETCFHNTSCVKGV